jgi:translation elongation factor EF-1alpha
MEVKVGKVTHYYNRIGVAVLELTGELKIGDKITIMGKNTELTQSVSSMEIEHRKVQSAGPGMEIALKVFEPVRHGDIVYKAVQEA